MTIRKIRGYVISAVLGFIIGIAIEIFMFVQFRNTVMYYNDSSKKIHREHVENLYKDFLVKMTEYIENRYPVLNDTAQLRQLAETARLREIAGDLEEIVKIFCIENIYYIEKNGDNYIYLLSFGISGDNKPELAGSPVPEGEIPAFIKQAWETKQPALSLSPPDSEWGSLISAARPIISNGNVTGIIGIDYNSSLIDSGFQEQELALEEKDNALLKMMHNFVLFSIAALVLLLSYQVWLSFNSAVVPLRQLEAEERTRLMLEATPMLCSLWNSEGSIIDCDEDSLKMHGVTKKSDYLEHYFEMNPEYQPDGERTRDAIKRTMTKALETGYTCFERTMSSAAGELIPVSTTVVRIPWKNTYCLAAYSRDLREDKAKEDKLRQITSITESSPNLTLFIGPGGNIEYMNPAVMDVSAYSAEELREQGLALLFSPIDFERLNRDYFTDALKNRPVKFDMIVITKNGIKYNYIFSAFAVQMHDGRSGIGMLGRDITELKRMQRDIMVARDQAERALESELQYNKAKSNLLSRVSHELRTPINAIAGMTDIARKTDDKSELLNCFDKIGTAAEHLLNLVNNLLDMTSFDTGSFDLVPAPFNISRTLEQITENISQKAKAKNQEFVHNIDSGMQDQIEGDERRLKQILLTLLSNAVKFTPENGRIEFSAGMTEKKGKKCTFCFQVSDNGIGISPDVLERLGNVFEQADTSITRQYSGMGLSLSLAKRIISLMQGEITVDSEAGKGSRFTCITRFDIAQEEGAIPEIPALADLAGKRIMIVDDIDINREILIALLEDTGAILDEAGNGEEAVNLFLANKYDLILMDLHMPVMDGLTATMKIRASGRLWAKTIPVISVSAENSEEYHAKARVAGINDSLLKPVDMEKLFSMIGKWMPG